MGAGGESDDEDLVRRARDGDHEAFRGLVRRYQSRAVAFGTRYLGSAAPARDAAQEAFVDLYLALPRYRAQDRFASYWHRLLLNRCRMAMRANRAREGLREELTRLRPDATLPPDDALIARQSQRAVNEGLERLSEKLRVVVALRFGAGLPLQDIADTLELPLGTVKSRLSSGLVELRSALKESDP